MRNIRRVAIVVGWVAMLFVSFFTGQAIGEFYGNHVIEKYW